jgi:phosphoribosylformimino-5-aminoimidazole carboxamide ribotide isomerase
MIILPAVDIKDGRCVRLYQGDYSRATTYGDDPVEVALRWQCAGANWLHVVDLDGALQGAPVNVELIKRIREATTLHIEVGGGMRSLEHIERILGLGVDRIILGTVAIRNPELLQEALKRWGERIVVGIDARDGWVAIAGWIETSRVQAADLAIQLSAAGVKRFIYTDISRDGALNGPNFHSLAEMCLATTSAMIASGGVRSIADLRALEALGVEGAIVGKALYTGDMDLATVLQEMEGKPQC